VHESMNSTAFTSMRNSKSTKALLEESYDDDVEMDVDDIGYRSED